MPRIASPSSIAAARVAAVTASSIGERAGLAVGDEIVAINGQRPRDVIEWHQLVDEPTLEIEVARNGMAFTVEIDKRAGEPLGVQVDSALFDQVRTCDNHCGFCFIYQLPPGLRRSLYVKDDDYRLSFLYGNFTTLTRFTELDLERVVSERLSPLHVSIHTTDPDRRAMMLRNRRGATSLRWLRALLDHGIEVHGQVVVCPGINDGDVLDDTLAGVLDEYPELASLCVVPLGVSRWSTEASMRAHTHDEAGAVVDLVEEYQDLFLSVLGRRLVFAADEYYLLTSRPFPHAESYEGFPMHEDGVGMARTFELEFCGHTERPTGVQSGFFASIDAAPAAGYRSVRAGLSVQPSRRAPVGVITGEYGARVLGPLVDSLGRRDVRLVVVDNQFFGGNVAVTGLLVGADIARVLADEPIGNRYLLPDVCLTEGRFLDGTTPATLGRAVELVATDGIALRKALS